MGTKPNESDLPSLHDLVQRSTLSAIEYHELAAKWTGGRGEGADIEANVDLNLQQRLDDASFGFRLVGEISTEFGEVKATVAVSYTYEGAKPSRRTFLAFGNEVAVMTLFPYFREGVGTISGKVFGEPILLPVVPRGELGFDLDAVEVEVTDSEGAS